MIYNIIELVIREAGIQKKKHFFMTNYNYYNNGRYRFKNYDVISMKMIPEVYLATYSLEIVYGMKNLPHPQ